MKLSVLAVRNGERVFWPLGAVLTVFLMTLAVVVGAVLTSVVFSIPIVTESIVTLPVPVGAGLGGHVHRARKAPLDELPQL